MANKNFAYKLQAARKQAGLTQKEAAEAMGIPPSTFGSWEIGKGSPDPEALIRLCVMYGIKEFTYFLDDDTEIKKATPQKKRSDLELLVGGLSSDGKRLSDKKVKLILNLIKAVAESDI